ncbi:hypothetical protein MAX14_22510, partial [Escherichia coli]
KTLSKKINTRIIRKDWMTNSQHDGDRLLRLVFIINPEESITENHKVRETENTNDCESCRDFFSNVATW